MSDQEMAVNGETVEVPLALLEKLRGSRLRDSKRRVTGYSYETIEDLIAYIPEPEWQATDDMAASMWERYRRIDGIATTMSYDEGRRQKRILAAAREVLIDHRAVGVIGRSVPSEDGQENEPT